MSAIKEVRCEICVFYVKDSEVSAKGDAGRCKRFPRQRTLMQNAHGETIETSNYPIVQQVDWCGEFYLKTETGQPGEQKEIPYGDKEAVDSQSH